MTNHFNLCSLLFLITATHLFAQQDAEVNFYFDAKLLTIDQNEGIALADFDNDGQLDLIAGRNWYAAPEFAPRPVRKIDDWNGYVHSNGDHVVDVDGDGLTDLVSGAFIPTKVHWYRNPGKKGLAHGSLWEQKLLFDTELRAYPRTEPFDLASVSLLH